MGGRTATGPGALSEGLATQAFPFKAQWWTKYLPDERWPKALDALGPFEQRAGHQRITREDVFDIADDTSEFHNTRLLVAAYVWGTGPNAFLVGRRARVFTRTDADRTEMRLAKAREVLYTKGAVEAYASMIHGGANHIAFLGPAFFTKFLFFAAGRPPAVMPPALILDRLVAAGLGARLGRSFGTAGWPRSTYQTYLEYATKCCAQDPRLTPELVEFALFSGRDPLGA